MLREAVYPGSDAGPFTLTSYTQNAKATLASTTVTAKVCGLITTLVGSSRITLERRAYPNV